MKRTVPYSLWVVTFIFGFVMVYLLATPKSSAGSEVEGETSGESIRVTTENRQNVRRGPVISDTGTYSSSTLSPVNQGARSGGGAGAGSASSGGASSGLFTYLGRRAICNVTESLGLDSSFCPTQTPAPPAAPALQPQPQVVSEPVEITITTSDLLELIPDSPQILMDRGPFGLKNGHTNFYASHHEPQTITRTMFDQEVTITATPIEFRWDYGDGNTLVTDLPGYPVDVFNTETDTSHQYAETGLYTVEMTTVFEGTYQVDGGAVQQVSSTVTQQADPTEIRIWRAVTRNVDQTCLENPTAWGCDTL